MGPHSRARAKWGSARPARGRGAVRLSTGRQRRPVDNRIPISPLVPPTRPPRLRPETRFRLK
ncbi:hypothetical protein DI458_35650 [Burkholderia contaminans]|nr:hypothetical protein [Burkholderia contaminans]QDS32477.1 hypothetical protein FPQ37_41965 [Burkholderia contaminans]RBQ57750.1 hypothetical protein DI458_35650 [Burkholderia contaminans]